MYVKINNSLKNKTIKKIQNNEKYIEKIIDILKELEK